MGGSFGILTSHPDLLPCQLLRLGPQVRLMEGGAHSTTVVGVGTVAGGETLLRRWTARISPAGLTDPKLSEPATALLYREQTLLPSASQDHDVQPLRHGSWLFSAEGELEAFPRVQSWVESELPPHLLRAVGTRSVAEASFALFLASLPQPDRGRPPQPREAAKLLAQVARQLAQRSASEGGVRAARLLLLATDGHLLLAARVGDLPAHVQLLEGSASCPRCRIGQGSKADAQVRAHRRARAVAVTSVPLSAGSHWLTLEDGGALGVGARLEPELL
jgi:hypothetical protein